MLLEGRFLSRVLVGGSMNYMMTRLIWYIMAF